MARTKATPIEPSSLRLLFSGSKKVFRPLQKMPAKTTSAKKKSAQQTNGETKQMLRAWQTRAFPKGATPLGESVETAASSTFEAARLLDFAYIHQTNPTLRMLQLLRVFLFVDNAAVNYLNRWLKYQNKRARPIHTVNYRSTRRWRHMSTRATA